MTTERETKNSNSQDRRANDGQDNDTPTAAFPTPSPTKGPDRKNSPSSTQGPERSSETAGQPGLEKEPNRDKAIGPGGQRVPSDTAKSTTAGREANVEGVDTPDGINQIDPTGQTTAEETKLL